MEFCDYCGEADTELDVSGACAECAAEADAAEEVHSRNMAAAVEGAMWSNGATAEFPN